MATVLISPMFDKACELVNEHIFVEGLLAILLPVWVDSQPELRKSAGKILTGRDIVPLVKFRGDLQLADDPNSIDAAIVALQEAQPEVDKEDARIMIICISGQYPFHDGADDEGVDMEIWWESALREIEACQP